MKNLILTATLFLLFSCSDNNPVVSGPDSAVATSLSVSTSTLSIDKSSGPSYIKIDSNTDWTVYVNNSGSTGRIPSLDVSPLSGTGDGTLRITYSSITTTYYDAQNATVVVYYYSQNIKQSKSIAIIRKAVTQ